jgi:hypothetical protein
LVLLRKSGWNQEGFAMRKAVAILGVALVVPLTTPLRSGAA